MVLMMRLTYRDGSSRIVTSNRDWQITRGPLTYSSIYGGEDYNATMEMPGWDMPDYSGTGG
jgi:alpha-L-rhamnosidase